MRAAANAITLAASAITLAACSNWAPDDRLVSLTARGEHGRATAAALRDLPPNPNNLDYGLASMRLAMTSLADGQVAAAETPFLALYEVLRTQGLNRESDVRVFFNDEEQAVYWKGEPYEQALGYTYFAAQLASVNDWYNANIAAEHAVFQLANFDKVIRERSNATPGPTTDPNAPETTDNAGYVINDAEFPLGYLMRAITAYAAGQSEEDRAEATDAFNAAIERLPEARPLADAVLSGRANTIFWIDAGLGPTKQRSGLANSQTTLRARTLSPARITATFDPPASPVAAHAADITRFARDYGWDKLAAARELKAALGEGLTVGGFVVMADANSIEQALVGGLLLLTGLTQQAGAVADIRHVEILPERSFLLAANITNHDTTATFELPTDPGSRLTIPNIDPPQHPERLTFRYVRLNATSTPPQWATSGTIRYAHDAWHQPVPGDGLPYILGGTCVRTPSPETLQHYRDHGNLLTLSLVELQNLYRAENITWDLGEQRGLANLHILEGGTSLIPAATGTAGYARLFCGNHPPYQPKSPELKAFIERQRPSTASP